MSYPINTGVLPDKLLGEANELVHKLSKEQLLWLGGYLSGIGLSGVRSELDTQLTEVSSVSANGDHKEVAAITVLLGSHSGNGKQIVKYLSAVASQQQKQLKVINMADYKVKNLKKEENLVIVVSTHGEGEPPADAADLHRFLAGKRVGSLEQLQYSVIALGDSSYKYFCKTGIDFHEQLKSHGAKPLTEPYLLDVDFKDHQERIAKELLDQFKFDGLTGTVPSNKHKSDEPLSGGLFHAELIDKVLLNGRGSNKETYHIELDLEDSGITYQPGDALEVYAVNNQDLVDQILRQVNFSGTESVQHKGGSYAIRELLLHHKEITLVTLPVLKKLSAFVEEPALNRLLDNRDELDSFLNGSDLLDVIKEFGIQVRPQELSDALRTLPPRAYSIASSQEEVGDEVHLTVGAVRYHKNERQHEGVCSTYLIDRLEEGGKVAVQLKSNDGFRLPDTETDIILIGAGTGIAPYRSFLQEREQESGKGRTWLFFGDQHFETDFLYQAEWLKYRQKNVLNKISIAFSRDQEDKIYVQHRIKQHADEVYDWLQKGAAVYVCGDRKKMAKDVEKAFVEILSNKEGLSTEQAEVKLLGYKKEGRYNEDVY
ncbi:diflavin oxidoreductase [Carboxylicivirga sp. RSCT41]|uniref:diflavin oxidoreductase n=1 Tax=Carboxylicivirga agarovorans TaxID=3417570 RepID=UPI003D35658A